MSVCTMLMHQSANASVGAFVFKSASNSLLLPPTCRELPYYMENEGFPHVALKLLLVLCDIWSLVFFRAVIPPFCVSSNIRTVQALALEYVVAFYPIFLILLTYVCIKLHDNNFRPIVWLWKPFHRHLARFRRRWDSKASIINAFTTFLRSNMFFLYM